MQNDALAGPLISALALKTMPQAQLCLWDQAMPKPTHAQTLHS